MNARLVFRDWRKEAPAGSVYSGAVGVELTNGDLHLGRVIPCEIYFPDNPGIEEELRAAMLEQRAYPVVKLLVTVPVQTNNQGNVTSIETDILADPEMRELLTAYRVSKPEAQRRASSWMEAWFDEQCTEEREGRLWDELVNAREIQHEIAVAITERVVTANPSNGADQALALAREEIKQLDVRIGEGRKLALYWYERWRELDGEVWGVLKLVRDNGLRALQDRDFEILLSLCKQGNPEPFERQSKIPTGEENS